jgi:hypothetical protein
MYVYESEFPIDYFSGMTQLSHYINLCFKNKEDPASYLSYYKLQKFLINSFMAVKCAVTNWEGDIRGDDIFISAIPWLDNTTKKILAFKQDNNGTSFIVSEFQLPLPVKDQQFQLMKLHDLNSQSIMIYFEESFELTVNLIERGTKENNTQVNVIHLDELKNLLNTQENKTSEKKDNLSDFEKIG